MEIDAKSCIGIDQWERLVILEHNKMKQSPTGLRPAFEAFLGNLEKGAATKDQSLGESEYRVFVDYTMPHDKETLEREFSVGNVWHGFTDSYEWQLHPLCAEIDQTPGERVMIVKHFGRDTKSEENIAEMDKFGYRPATHLEAYAFAKTYPSMQLNDLIAALGSFVLDGEHRLVAVLGHVYGPGKSDGPFRVLIRDFFSRMWGSGRGFLFVRK